MKISAVTSFNTNLNNYQLKNNRINFHQSTTTNNNNNNLTSFLGIRYIPISQYFKFSNKSADEIHDMAEYFNEFTKEQLKESLTDLDGLWHRIIGSTETRDKAVNTLYPYIKNIKLKKMKYTNMIKNNNNPDLAKSELERLERKSGRVYSKYFFEEGDNGAPGDDVIDNTNWGIY